MNKTMGVLTIAAACLGAAGAARAETITHSVSGKTEQWYISQPVVNVGAWRTFRGQIGFRYGDQVTITAGGCVQTGGSGKTWKRYVAPQGANSDRLYFGVFAMPSVPVHQFRQVLAPVSSGSDVWTGTFWIGDVNIDNDSLWLAYSDDGYGDNGYYSHDDGTNDQCKGVGAAWIMITAVHLI
jgi:hypothetical protein